jgi:hypothetical protein
MKFYAYIPDKNGLEPLGTMNRVYFELKTLTGAIKRARKLLGDKFVLCIFENLYDDKTYTKIYEFEKNSMALLVNDIK